MRAPRLVVASLLALAGAFCAASVQAPSAAAATLVFADEFNGTALSSQWSSASDAYSDACRGNKPDHKLEYNRNQNLTVSGGALSITAKRQNYTSGSTTYNWTSGLITTGRTCGTIADGFNLKAGDHLEIRADLPSELGAWPALWTWFDEVDAFEYHTDNPNLLELTNHTTGDGTYYDTGFDVSSGYHLFGVYLGSTSVKYYLDGAEIYADNTGFHPTNGKVFPMVNLSVSDGYYHAAPASSTTQMVMKVDYLHVYR